MRAKQFSSGKAVSPAKSILYFVTIFLVWLLKHEHAWSILPMSLHDTYFPINFIQTLHFLEAETLDSIRSLFFNNCSIAYYFFRQSKELNKLFKRKTWAVASLVG